jgi:hypothetical protein
MAARQGKPVENCDRYYFHKLMYCRTGYAEHMMGMENHVHLTKQACSLTASDRLR